MKNLPPIRSENIVVQEIENEVLVYDLSINKAFCLNETSSKVYDACGNSQTFNDLKSKYQFSDDLIYFALDELDRNNLLAEKYESPLSKINRREVIKKVGLASMAALPLIVGITAPQAVQAQSSLVGLGEPCNNNCLPGLQCTTQFGIPTAVCRAPGGQPCDYNRPDFCLSGCCGASPDGPVCCNV